MGQLADARARLAQAAAEEEQSRVKLGMAEKALKGLEKLSKEVEKRKGKAKGGGDVHVRGAQGQGKDDDEQEGEVH